ncbi:hypothetical protein [Streptomyces sp. NPDC093589]|uniref:hypothetical protein n=1 Tax=Streptomyces sp. NPDC093589 TaxID=3366043 RepID=UPI00382C42B4
MVCAVCVEEGEQDPQAENQRGEVRDDDDDSRCFVLAVTNASGHDKLVAAIGWLKRGSEKLRSQDHVPLARCVSTWLHLIQPKAIVAEVDSHLVMLFSGRDLQEWTSLQHNLDDFLRRVELTAPSLAVVVGRELHDVHELSDDFTHLRTLVRLTALGLVNHGPGGAVVLMEQHLPQLDLALLADWHRSTNHLRVPVLERMRESDRERG